MANSEFEQGFRLLLRFHMIELAGIFGGSGRVSRGEKIDETRPCSSSRTDVCRQNCEQHSHRDCKERGGAARVRGLPEGTGNRCRSTRTNIRAWSQRAVVWGRLQARIRHRRGFRLLALPRKTLLRHIHIKKSL